MENLDAILRRTIKPKNTSQESTGTSSGTDQDERAVTSGTDKECSLCQGAGFLRLDVPFGHPDFGRLAPCDCRKREFERERFERLYRISNIGPLIRLTFDNLISRGRTGDPANQERFARGYTAAKAFAEDPKGWLVLTGISGCGKTHLAAAIANYQLQQGRPVFFIVVPDLLDHLRATYGPNSDISYDELFDQVRNVPLLVLDDLGTQSSTPWAKEKLFQLINHRYNAQLPTVITTNEIINDLEPPLRMRLADPSLSQVLVLEERASDSFQCLGGLGLELLNSMTFENFDFKRLNLGHEDRVNLEGAFRLARRFAESPEGWLVFTGTIGCGKTHLAAAVANYRLRAGHPAHFVVVPDLLDHLRSTFSPDSKITYDELFEQIKGTPLLILDDLGAQSTSSWAQEKLYQILNYRYNARLATVITTSYRLEDIDPRLSSRMIDPRLSTVFLIQAPDYRGDRNPDDRSRNPAKRVRKPR